MLMEVSVYPEDNVPNCLASGTSVGDNGVRAHIYTLREGVSVYHVSTFDEEELQEEVTTLVEQIQQDIILSRENYNSPFFTYTTPIGMVPGTDGPPLLGLTDSDVVSTPQCIVHVWNHLERITSAYYGSLRRGFNQISILAWHSSGKRKWKVLRAKKDPIVILCLGAEVALNFVPKGGYQSVPSAASEDTLRDQGGNYGIDADVAPRTPTAAYHEAADAFVWSADCIYGLPEARRDQVPYSPISETNDTIDTDGIRQNAQITDHPDVGMRDADATGLDPFESDARQHIHGNGSEGSAMQEFVIEMDTPVYRMAEQRSDPRDVEPKASCTGLDTLPPPATAPSRPETVPPSQGGSKGKATKAKKDPKPSIPAFTITLVHGNSVILTGDSYEVRTPGWHSTPINNPSQFNKYPVSDRTHRNHTARHRFGGKGIINCLSVANGSSYAKFPMFLSLLVVTPDTDFLTLNQELLAYDYDLVRARRYKGDTVGKSVDLRRNRLVVASSSDSSQSDAGYRPKLGRKERGGRGEGNPDAYVCQALQVPNFKAIDGPYIDGERQRVVKAAAGITFSIVLTESGKAFSFGSGEKGQLGNGRTGEHITTGNKTAFDIEPEPIPVKGLDDSVITDIACGPQHAIAIDTQGIVYVWGYNGYCRLGLGNQQDVLIPKVVPQFAGPNVMTMGAQVVAGTTNSVVIDKQRMYWMAGKWKNSGEGSAGSPYSSFRYIQDLMGCKISAANCGGVTHFALTTDEDGGVMTVAYGQNAANGELGLGPDEPKSATKPTPHQPLTGIEVFSVAAGQHSTLFLAKPNDKFSDIPRHPLEVDAPELCVTIPDGEWFCPKCTDEIRVLAGLADSGSQSKTSATDQAKGGAKRKAPLTSIAKENASKRRK
ncbi:hypothetical protein ID866_6193 [Astraeus odoratus]|nr:hypothetical protein ID866_6193 [Astraeus odoratus]